LAFFFAFGARYYHTGDPLLFLYQNMHISAFLNSFYILVLGYAAVVSIFLVAQKLLTRIIFVLLYIICLAPIVINLYQNINLEYSFFGVGFLGGLSSHYFQPIFILFHGLIPLLFLIYLMLSFGRSKVPAKVAGRGFARSLSFLMIFVFICGLSLMQKNRVAWP